MLRVVFFFYGVAPAGPRHRGLHRVNCSRVMNCTSTVIAAIVPWNLGAIYILGLYGVNVFQFTPYSVYIYLLPIAALLFAALGIRNIPASCKLENGEKYRGQKA